MEYKKPILGKNAKKLAIDVSKLKDSTIDITRKYISDFVRNQKKIGLYESPQEAVMLMNVLWKDEHGCNLYFASAEGLQDRFGATISDLSSRLAEIDLKKDGILPTYQNVPNGENERFFRERDRYDAEFSNRRKKYLRLEQKLREIYVKILEFQGKPLPQPKFAYS